MASLLLYRLTASPGLRHFSTSLRFFGVALALLGTAAGCRHAGEAASRPADVDDVALVVNGQAIHQSEIDQVANEIRGLLTAQYSPDQLKQREPEIKAQAREQVITEKVIDQAVEREQAHPTAEQIEAEVSQIELMAQIRGTTLEQMLATRGLTPESLRQQLHLKLARQMLWDKMLQLQPPDELQLRDYYERHKADRFLVPEGVRAGLIRVALPGREAERDERQELRDLAESLRQRLISGETIQSVGAEAAEKAGSRDAKIVAYDDAAWRTRSEALPAELFDVLLRTPLGQVTAVTRAGAGYWIAQVLEKRPARLVTYEEARPACMQALMEQARKGRTDGLIKQLREQAKIETFE